LKWRPMPGINAGIYVTHAITYRVIWPNQKTGYFAYHFSPILSDVILSSVDRYVKLPSNVKYVLELMTGVYSTNWFTYHSICIVIFENYPFFLSVLSFYFNLSFPKKFWYLSLTFFFLFHPFYGFNIFIMLIFSLYSRHSKKLNSNLKYTTRFNINTIKICLTKISKWNVYVERIWRYQTKHNVFRLIEYS